MIRLLSLSSLILFSITYSSCSKDDEPGVADIDVVINELMASNSETVADQDDQYDDWIELYNLSASEADLSGYYLSDNDNNLTRWRFPDGTVIAGNGYLIVWADSDLGQDGLHADFKLSADGEELYLVTPDLEIGDEVTFDAQVGEVSYSRSPNGTGSFIWTAPTFNASNGGL